MDSATLAPDRLCTTAPRRGPGYTIAECGAQKWKARQGAQSWIDDECAAHVRTGLTHSLSWVRTSHARSR
eukprot:894951-Alexandrium_andersonii.AAC.1